MFEWTLEDGWGGTDSTKFGFVKLLMKIEELRKQLTVKLRVKT